MTELTLEQLRFARAIGATHSCVIDGILIYFKEDVRDPFIHVMSYIDDCWKDVTGCPTVMNDPISCVKGAVKINFDPLDEAKQPEKQIDMVNNPRNKYMREIKPGFWVDVYDVIQAWKVTNSAQQHLIKKALQGGQRGHKDYETDMRDIIASATRAIELDRAAQELGK